MEHSGKARLARVGAVDLRENVGATRDAHDVFVPVTLTEMFANAARKDGKVQNVAPL
ncbi:MAG: hypothetical protein JO322_03995 [Candidatus Eremiobacteraeota bacterium]|nr:hypothetical protein [Candidatus Eremiobacteraeota bacterium]